MLGSFRRQPTNEAAQDELPPGWDTARAEDEDTVYYINQWTRILQSELPTKPALPQGWDIAASKTTGCEYYINAELGRMSASFDDVVHSLKPEGSQLPANKKISSSSVASSASATASNTSAAKEVRFYNADVRFYLKHVGLGAWVEHFERHLPANVKSVELIKATTAADLRRMATKANMRLDFKTTRQVLNALKKKPKLAGAVGVAFWNFSDSTVEVYHGLKFVASLGPNRKHGMYAHKGASFDFRLPPTGDDRPEPFATWKVTDHHSQQVITEGSAVDGLSLGAIVCHNTDPRYDEYRMRAVELITDGLVVGGKPVTVQAICERGNLQQFAQSSVGAVKQRQAQSMEARKRAAEAAAKKGYC